MCAVPQMQVTKHLSAVPQCMYLHDTRYAEVSSSETVIRAAIFVNLRMVDAY